MAGRHMLPARHRDGLVSSQSAFAAGEAEVLIKPVVGAEDAFSLAQGQSLGLGLGGVEYPPDQVR